MNYYYGLANYKGIAVGIIAYYTNILPIKTNCPKMLNEFENTGRIWLRGQLTAKQCDRLSQNCQLEQKIGARISNNTSLASMLKQAIDADLLVNLGVSAQPVRIVSFNKSKENNWAVPWHQDRIIAVKDRHDLEGFHNWSIKSGTHHCEPPISILQKMIFIRIHLDETTPENGAMEIAIGSHKKGIIKSSEAATIANQCEQEYTSANRGDILVLKMLMLHRSSSSTSNAARRTIRADFAAKDCLPLPIKWT